MDIKTTISATEARQKLAEVIDTIEKTGARYTLTVNGKPRVTIIDAEELESLQETVDILSINGALSRIRTAEKELANQESLTLDELLDDGFPA